MVKCVGGNRGKWFPTESEGSAEVWGPWAGGQQTSQSRRLVSGVGGNRVTPGPLTHTSLPYCFPLFAWGSVVSAGPG